MSYANFSSHFKIYCPAIDKEITYEIISHHNHNNRFANHDLSYRCCDMDICPLKYCEANYEDGKLKIRD